VPSMRYKFMRERIVATLKEYMASPSFTLLGSRQTAGSTPTTSRGAPTTAVTSLTTRPAGSNTRYRYRTSSGGTGSGSGTPRSSNPGRSSRDRNVRALETTTETSSFDDDSSLEATDDFIVAKSWLHFPLRNSSFPCFPFLLDPISRVPAPAGK